MKNFKFSLAWQILIALILGIVVGAVLHNQPEIKDSIVNNVLTPLGKIFISLIKMIVIPIVFSTLILGIAGVGSTKSLGRLGFKTILYFEIITTIAILVGLVAKDKAAYFNSVLGFNSVDNRPQFYHKYHLVPFGEFIPLKAVFGWVYRDWLNMPLSDLSRGEKYQQPIQLANQKIAVNICYEDVFGEEIIRQLPQATLLVNVSNDAWYGHSNAADQHMQFSQMRALETGRTMLRATNTGSTTIISPQGMILALLPQFETAILNGSAQGYVGATPFVRWGNWPTIGLLLIALILLWGRKKK